MPAGWKLPIADQGKKIKVCASCLFFFLLNLFEKKGESFFGREFKGSVCFIYVVFVAVWGVFTTEGKTFFGCMFHQWSCDEARVFQNTH